MFQDVIADENVEYIAPAIPYRLQLHSWVERALYRVHFSRVANRFFELPFKKRWYRDFYKGEDRGNMCFVFFMDVLLPQYIPLFEQLRAGYPGCRLVVYLIDLLASRYGALEVPLIGQYMDLALSYDKQEAERYGLAYYPTFMSRLPVPDDPGLDDSDFCFIGAAKNREEVINKLYACLSGYGYRCDFVVLDESARGRGKLLPGIRTIKKPLSYPAYLAHVKKCRCIVEIQQTAASGYTLRALEALLYQKKLLTSNPSITDYGFYDPDQFLLWSKTMEPSALDAFLSQAVCLDKAEILASISPKRFLEVLTARLNQPS